MTVVLSTWRIAPSWRTWQALTRLDTPPLSNRRHPDSPIAHEAELRLHAGTLAIEHRLRVGRGAVRLVRALFTLEIDRRVAPATGVVRRRIVGTVPRLEGLHGRPRFDQRAVDAEMLTG